jgi:hypothetical protein
VDECYTSEILILKQEMIKVKIQKINEEIDRKKLFGFYGGVARQQHIAFSNSILHSRT